MIIYVAGPYTHPNPEGRARNVAAAVEAGRRIMAAGHTPFVPHVAVQPIVSRLPAAEQNEAAMALCLTFVDRSDVLVRLPGASDGANREVARAEVRCLPVYLGVDELLAALVRIEAVLR